MKLNILAFAAHPDDVELSCCGTLLKHINLGYKVGIIDLTSGELGTRGSAALREAESNNAAELMGVHVRENMRMSDGFFQNDVNHQLPLIKILRKYQPDIVFCNALTDRHIDHGRGAKLQADSCFLSGLRKIETFDDSGNLQDAWRPKAIYHYIQDYHLSPDIVVDITNEWEKKIEVLKCFKSQFYDPNSSEPLTPIATEDFWEFLPSRARDFGRIIGAKYAEGFNVVKAIGVSDFTKLT